MLILYCKCSTSCIVHILRLHLNLCKIYIYNSCLYFLFIKLYVNRIVVYKIFFRITSNCNECFLLLIFYLDQPFKGFKTDFLPQFYSGKSFSYFYHWIVVKLPSIKGNIFVSSKTSNGPFQKNIHTSPRSKLRTPLC